MAAQTMKAVNYVGPHQVKVEDVEKPKLQHPDDIIVKVTTVSGWRGGQCTEDGEEHEDQDDEASKNKG